MSIFMVYTYGLNFLNHLLNTEWKLSWPQLFEDKNFTKWRLINFDKLCLPSWYYPPYLSFYERID